MAPTAPSDWIDARRLDSRLRRELKPVAGSDRQVWLAKPDVFVVPIIQQCASTDEDAEAWEDMDLWELMDAAFPARRHEVECAVSSSMMSGTWGMDSISLADRGYFVENPDSETAGDAPFRLLGAWEPFDDDEAYRSAFVEAYVASWADIGLPPFRGEHAGGPLDLMTQAVMRIGGPRALFDAWERDAFEPGTAPLDVDDLAARAGLPSGTVRDISVELDSGTLDLEALTEDDRGRAFLAITLAQIDTSPFKRH
jgi:hypothetical protein